MTVWRRSDTGWGYREEAGLDATIDMQTIAIALPLSDLCQDLEFPPGP